MKNWQAEIVPAHPPLALLEREDPSGLNSSSSSFSPDLFATARSRRSSPNGRFDGRWRPEGGTERNGSYSVHDLPGIWS